MARHSSRQRPPGRQPRSRGPHADEGEANVVFGINPVRELLRAEPDQVERLWVTPTSAAFRGVAAEARSQGVVVELSDRVALDQMTGGGHHQGVVARVRPFSYVTLDEVLTRQSRLLVVLDGILDPQNLGAIMRSAEVLGARGLILPRDRAAGVTAAAIRASSGAALHLPTAQVPNLVRALAAIKRAGYWAVALDSSGPVSFQQLPAIERAVLVIGGEGGGARRLVLEACDFRVRIPTLGRVGSLNASVAAGVGLFALVSRLPDLAAREPRELEHHES